MGKVIKIDLTKEMIHIEGNSFTRAYIGNCTTNVLLTMINAMPIAGENKFDVVFDATGNEVPQDKMLCEFNIITVSQRLIDYAYLLNELRKSKKYGGNPYIGINYIRNTQSEMELKDRDLSYKQIEQELKAQSEALYYSKNIFKIICCSGPPGIGKTRFLLEFLDNVTLENTAAVIGISFNGTTPYKRDESNPVWTRIFENIQQPLPPNLDAKQLYLFVSTFCSASCVVLLVDEYNALGDQLEPLMSSLAAIQKISCDELKCPLHVIICGTDYYGLTQSLIKSNTLAAHIVLGRLSDDSTLDLFNKSDLPFDQIVTIMSYCAGIPRLFENALKLIKNYPDGNILQSMIQEVESYLKRDNHLLACVLLKIPFVDEVKYNEYFLRANSFGPNTLPFIPPVYLHNWGCSDVLINMLVDDGKQKPGSLFENVCFAMEALTFRLQNSLGRDTFTYFGDVCKVKEPIIVQDQGYFNGWKNDKWILKSVKNRPLTILVDNKWKEESRIEMDQKTNFVIKTGANNPGYDILINRELASNEYKLYFIQCKYRSTKSDSPFVEAIKNYLKVLAGIYSYPDQKWTFIGISTDSVKVDLEHTLSTNEELLALKLTVEDFSNFRYLNNLDVRAYLGDYICDMHRIVHSNDKLRPQWANAENLGILLGSAALRNFLNKRNEIWKEERRLITKKDKVYGFGEMKKKLLWG